MTDTKQAEEVYPVPEALAGHCYINGIEEYKDLYHASIADDSDQFWGDMARKQLSWFQPFTDVRFGSFEQGDVAWFLNGRLNVSYNCIDRHLKTRGDQVAILWEGDEPDQIRRITYRQLFAQVCQTANALRAMGVRRGDPVCIYMPMIPEAAVAMLACARIGAPHSVVFAGFSAESLRSRIQDCDCRFVITADEGRRGGKAIPLKRITDEALIGAPHIQRVLVCRHTGTAVPMLDGRDVWWHDEVNKQRPYCPAESMDSEDTLFFLYTSGSTGRPKGILHTTGGYLLYAALTHRYVFDYRDGDIYACMADIGWITGHSYIVYGPLCNGATTFMFESTPFYPTPTRYWDCVQRHGINILYTAPTVIRALMKFGKDPVQQHDRSSLRILGSVGEPINPEAWRWYFNVVGDGKCAIVDTFWQTETGGIVITPLPGGFPTKPGSATRPFLGVKPILLDPTSGQPAQPDEQGNTTGVLCIQKPWPSVARTIYGDHHRYLDTYMNPYRGYYFTGDGAIQDADGYFFITGRVDDVINVSGHRIGSAEVESALVLHHCVAEAAVIGVPHDIKGSALFAYVIPKHGLELPPTLAADLKKQVRKEIGAFAVPDEVLITPALPKTRSGKIMRRILRKVASNEIDSLGDVSTLAEPHVVEDLIRDVAALRAGPQRE
eukprot:TRINITY_DN5572_c0_g1_i1.p1 TRINITY_DN5572_c0_g1~~TRINITY_DN5572_c0_g1_i1.p1  ORF type:complete len:664 (+),score=141.62 TRINITY_DN5572_c0_g1_i1:76-2067(+)